MMSLPLAADFAPEHSEITFRSPLRQCLRSARPGISQSSSVGSLTSAPSGVDLKVPPLRSVRMTSSLRNLGTSVMLPYCFFQNEVVNIRSMVNSSRRPMSMSSVLSHLAPTGSALHE